MRIAYIHQHFSTKKGATGTRSYEMSQRLIRAGHDVTMICGVNQVLTRDCFEVNDRVNKMDIDGIRVICIAEPYANEMSFTRRLVAFGRFAREATKILSRLELDLVFATSTPLTVGIPGMKAARRLGVPFVFEVRDLWPELPIAMGIIKNPVLKWYTRRLEHRIYQAAQGIVALAPGIKEGICRTGYPENQVAVIPNAADLDLFRPRDQRTSDPEFGKPEDLKLVFTGAHGLANGLDAVLDAAAELKRRGERGVRFIFIGHGSQRDRLMRRSQEEGLEELTVWKPSISKESLAQLLPQMDAGMMILKNIPAFYYGTSPNKFFDYIACGLPVLNNYPGWLANVITDNRCGMVAPADNAQAFVEAVLWLRDHPDERRAMGARSRELAERSFSRDQLAGEFVTFLEQFAPHTSLQTKR